jgi:hypothetical protein
MDWIQDLTASSGGNTQVAVAVDKSTRMVVARAYPNRNTDSCLDFLYHIMMRYGCPSTLITDRASVFLSLEFKKFCSTNAIRHFASTSYHPQTNGLVERVNGVLETMLAKLCAGAWDKWDSYLDAATFNLNARTHTVTGHSPFFLAFGFHPRLPGDTTHPHVFDFDSVADRRDYTARQLTLLGQARAAAFFRTHRQATRMTLRHATTHRTETQRFQVGEFVKRKVRRLPSQMPPKFSPVWEGPFIIDSVGEHDSYRLKHPNGQLEPHPVNANHLAPYVTRQTGT